MRAPYSEDRGPPEPRHARERPRAQRPPARVRAARAVAVAAQGGAALRARVEPRDACAARTTRRRGRPAATGGTGGRARRGCGRRSSGRTRCAPARTAGAARRRRRRSARGSRRPSPASRGRRPRARSGTRPATPPTASKTRRGIATAPSQTCVTSLLRARSPTRSRGTHSRAAGPGSARVDAQLHEAEARIGRELLGDPRQRVRLAPGSRRRRGRTAARRGRAGRRSCAPRGCPRRSPARRRGRRPAARSAPSRCRPPPRRGRRPPVRAATPAPGAARRGACPA